jgi:ComF family protein
MLSKFIFVERCRGCRSFIKYGKDHKSTVCELCWESIAGERPILDHCYVSDDTLESILVASGTRYDGLVKTLVYKLKYDNDVLIAKDLAGLLEVAWHQVEHLVEGDAVLVPIPLHWWRLVKRGYNQADLLSEHLSKVTGLRIDRTSLSRAKATKAHHGLKRAERIINIQGAFVANSARVAGKSVLLVDDI